MEHDIYLYAAIFGCTLVGLQVILQVFGLLDTDAADALDADASHSMDAAGAHDFDPGADAHGSSLFFGILSFKALCAFAGIFGLVGLVMLQSESAQRPMRMLVATASGAAAMFGVAWMMRALSHLQSSGTIDIRNAIGRTGSVYLRIPRDGEGTGKVTVEVQGRSMEFPAITDGDEIPTGQRVTVVAVVGRETVKVTPL